MQIYVKSAGFSVNQDYAWVDQSGDRVDIDLSTLSYNVDGVTFVWKSINAKIFIFANSFIDNSRRDLYNRPLRNYMLLEGKIDETDFMYGCFEKMLLDQVGFASILNNSVCNVSGDSPTGFSVDFAKLNAYFEPQPHDNRETGRLERHLYEKDSDECRRKLLGELFEIKGSSVTLIVGGELSEQQLKELAPDRALLNRVSDIGIQAHPVSDNNKKNVWIKWMVCGLPVVTIAALLLSMTGKKKNQIKNGEIANEKQRYRNSTEKSGRSDKFL